ncbi:hypothetical protein D3C86_1266480 [compost metagenome]
MFRIIERAPIEKAQRGSSIQTRNVAPACSDIGRGARLIFDLSIGDKSSPASLDNPVARLVRAHRFEVLGLFVELEP